MFPLSVKRAQPTSEDVKPCLIFFGFTIDFAFWISSLFVITIKISSYSLAANYFLSLNALAFWDSIKPCLIFNHPLFHVLLSMTRVFHYLRMSLTVMRLKCFHPFFECFTFRRYFA